MSQHRAAPGKAEATLAEHYLVLLTCRDEQHQLLASFRAEGLECRAPLS